jgi:hypothetical protein
VGGSGVGHRFGKIVSCHSFLQKKTASDAQAETSPIDISFVFVSPISFGNLQTICS